LIGEYNVTDYHARALEVISQRGLREDMVLISLIIMELQDEDDNANPRPVGNPGDGTGLD
jgi:hypothetical protein